MIIRRRPTAHFTTIGNALFADERLAADELGVMAFLLSKPADWEVRRPALMRRFKIGRDTIRRMMANLIKTGWCHAEKTRLTNGTFSVIYEIRDECGPELTDEEVRRALSLVSSEAAEDDSAASHVPIGDDPPEPCAQPPTAQPGVANQGVASRMWSYKDSQNTDDSKTESTQAAPLWRDVRAAWPPQDVLSPLVCEELFAKLSREDRKRAADGIEPYLRNCRARNRKVCDLSTYLKEKRFKGQTAVRVEAFECRPGSAEMHRWRAYWKAIGEPHPFAEAQWAAGRAVTTRSQWPSALPSPKVQSDSTGPPDKPRIAEDDLTDLAREMTG